MQVTKVLLVAMMACLGSAAASAECVVWSIREEAAIQQNRRLMILVEPDPSLKQLASPESVNLLTSVLALQLQKELTSTGFFQSIDIGKSDAAENADVLFRVRVNWLSTWGFTRSGFPLLLPIPRLMAAMKSATVMIDGYFAAPVERHAWLNLACGAVSKGVFVPSKEELLNKTAQELSKDLSPVFLAAVKQAAEPPAARSELRAEAAPVDTAWMLFLPGPGLAENEPLKVMDPYQRSEPQWKRLAGARKTNEPPCPTAYSAQDPSGALVAIASLTYRQTHDRTREVVVKLSYFKQGLTFWNPKRILVASFLRVPGRIEEPIHATFVAEPMNFFRGDAGYYVQRSMRKDFRSRTDWRWIANYVYLRFPDHGRHGEIIWDSRSVIEVHTELDHRPVLIRLDPNKCGPASFPRGRKG